MGIDSLPKLWFDIKFECKQLSKRWRCYESSGNCVAFIYGTLRNSERYNLMKFPPDSSFAHRSSREILSIYRSCLQISSIYKMSSAWIKMQYPAIWSQWRQCRLW